MKAAIIPFQLAAGLRPLRYLTADFLIPVAGKPLAEHLVEFCVSSGIGEILLLVEDDPGAVERYFGTGERWGAVIQVKSVDENLPLTLQLAAAFEGLEGAVCCLPANMLVAGDFSLPAAEAASRSLPVVAGEPGAPALFVADAGFLHEALQTFGAMDYIGLLKFLKSAENQPFICKLKCRLLTNLKEYLEAQRLILDESWPGVRIPGSRREDGIWIGDHVTIASRITLVPPLLIGHHCRIDGSGTIGPNAVIAPFCLVNDTDLIEESVLLPGTATGPHTELSHLVVRGSRIVNARSGISVTSPDAFILGEIGKTDEKKPARTGYLLIVLLAAVLGMLLWFFLNQALPYSAHMVAVVDITFFNADEP
jgi:NDP-sugar pyrophosphorylase family protein